MLIALYCIRPEDTDDWKIVRFLTCNLVLCSMVQMSIQLQNVQDTEEEREGERERERVCYNIVSMREIKEPVHWQGRAILAHCV